MFVGLRIVLCNKYGGLDRCDPYDDPRPTAQTRESQKQELRRLARQEFHAPHSGRCLQAPGRLPVDRQGS